MPLRRSRKGKGEIPTEIPCRACRATGRVDAPLVRNPNVKQPPRGSVTKRVPCKACKGTGYV